MGFKAMIHTLAVRCPLVLSLNMTDSLLGQGP